MSIFVILLLYRLYSANVKAHSKITTTRRERLLISWHQIVGIKMEHNYYTPVFIENIDDELNNSDTENIENVEKGSDELLIDAVREYPHLYNSSLKEYKDAQMKENSWTEIGLLMNVSSKI